MSDLTVYCWHNSVRDAANTGIAMVEVSGASLVVTAENNVATDCASDFAATGSPSITANGNCSSDATADDWGGTGNQIGKASADCFVSATDSTPKRSGPLYRAGAAGVVDTDALGRQRRPRGAQDIGALTTYRRGVTHGGAAR